MATAARSSFWTGSWQVVLGPRVLELVRPSLWSSRYELRDGGRVVGAIRRRGVFRVRPEVTLPADLPPAFQVFVVAVVLAQWRRESSSVAGAGGVSAAIVTTGLDG